MRLLGLFVLVFVAFATPAGAAELYRCTIKGRTVYQDAPCKGGRIIDTEKREVIRGYGAGGDEGAPEAVVVPAPTPTPYKPPTAAVAPPPENECTTLAAKAGNLRAQVRAAGAEGAQTRSSLALRETEQRMAVLKCP